MDYELRDRQEASARHHVRWLKAFYASLCIGFLFLLLPHAAPWFSSGAPTTAMGRAMSSTLTLGSVPFFLVSFVHLVLAVCYGFIIAMLIFRFETRLAIVLGGLIGLALYGINFLLFRKILGTPPVNEAPVLVTHLFFSLIFSGAYKGISIPDAKRVQEK